MTLPAFISQRSWVVGPGLALATLYFAIRYAAADDQIARACMIVSALLVVGLAAVRYLRARPRPSWPLLVASGAATGVVTLGRWLDVPPFSGWREAIPACLTIVTAVLLVLARQAAPTERPDGEIGTRASRVALLLLAVLGPALLQAGNNMSFLPGFMLAPYLVALALLGATAYLVVAVTTPTEVSRSTVAIVAAGFAMSIVVLPSTRAMMRMDGSLLFDFFLLFALVTWALHAIARRSPRFVIISLAVFAGLQILGIAQTVLTDVASTADAQRSKVPADVADATISDTPNVYVLVYDGIPEFETLEALGFDSTAHRELFERYDFEVYPGTYSLAAASLESMARTFDMREQLQWPTTITRASSDQRGAFYQRIRAGASATHHLFHRLGYVTYAILPTYLVGNIHTVSELLPKGTHPHLELGATLLRGVLQGEFRADTKGYRKRHGSENLVREKLAVITEGQSPRFVDSHVIVPGHSPNTGRCRDNERELWGERYRRSLDLMERDFATIEQHDPTAIVVAMSDHGPDLTGERCTGLWSYTLDEITRLDVLDRHSTMVAIRWPDPERADRYDGDLLTNQDILPTVFAYLYDSPVPLSWKVPREVAYRGHVLLRDGRFVPYAGPPR